MPSQGRSKKRKIDDVLGEENDVDGESDMNASSSDQEKGRLSLKFACPYFKNDPSRYGQRKTCCGPGWDTVHRVKEHLYRNHKQPKYRCRRCWKSFKEEEPLQEHQRLLTPCTLEPVEPIEGIDDRQEKLLRSRNHAFTKLSEYDKWREVYMILFLDTEAQDIPYPYYEFGQVREAHEVPDDCTQLAHVLNKLREVPGRAKERLEVELYANPSIDQQMASNVIDICTNIFSEIARDFENSWLSAERLPESIASTQSPPQHINPNESLLMQTPLDDTQTTLPWDDHLAFGPESPADPNVVSQAMLLLGLQGYDYGSYEWFGSGKRATEPK